MPLFLHLSIHVALALMAGFIVFLLTRKFWLSFIFAFIGGVAVDFDHLIDYFLAYGFNFSYYNFTHGLEFMKSQKMYTLFHGWEYALGFLILGILFRPKWLKAVFLGLGLGLLVHLGADVMLNNIPFQSYSITHKIKNNFEMKRLLEEKEYQEFLRDRDVFGFK